MGRLTDLEMGKLSQVNLMLVQTQAIIECNIDLLEDFIHIVDEMDANEIREVGKIVQKIVEGVRNCSPECSLLFKHFQEFDNGK